MPKFEHDIVINAPVETVWNVITDPNHWSQWFPGIESVVNAATISVGGTVQWNSEGKTGQATIAKMDPLKTLAIETQLGNDKDSHVFQLQPAGGFLGMGANQCKVSYILDTLMGGGILSNFIAGGNPKDMMRVNNAMNLLKKTVEGH